MSHRFTALVLALIVASPLCCGGWVHAAEKPNVESCCEAKEPGKTTPHPEGDKDCACSQTPKFRDVSHAGVTVPAPELTVLLLPEFALLDLGIPNAEDCSAALVLHYHGPPRTVRPLYHLDCALIV